MMSAVPEMQHSAIHLRAQKNDAKKILPDIFCARVFSLYIIQTDK